jgi:hypothetical protein
MDYYDLMQRFHRLPFLVLLVCAITANAQTADSNKVSTPISSALDSPLFYELLLGELNARGGDP